MYQNLKKRLHKIRLLFRKYILKKKYDLICGINVELEDGCNLEGHNLLADGTYIRNCDIGFASYIGRESWIENSIIGRYTSIGPHVQTIIGKHPTKKFVSTHPAFFSTQKQVGFSFVKENEYDEFMNLDKKGHSIRIGSDVWIGANAMIMEGVTIGDGSIIGAGALVNKDIPDYAVAVGVPAKVIRYRFDDKQVNYLKEVLWWEKDFDWIEKHADKFIDIDEFIKGLC